MPLIHFGECERAVAPGELLSLLGWAPCTNERSKLRGVCPLCESNKGWSRSLLVDGWRWKCFRCGAAGRLFTLFAQVMGLSRYRAVLEVFKLLGREPAWQRWG